ncbi:MAG: class I SAM-dependent methyltransferase [Bacteroidetes bacterium]|nr:class I SAM-dependent methyltransferase [Bacteroidota bacterium]MBU1679067.1 class I SAM-dependent methyltransferase [Bacteroidota bacterium]MBU2507180.1 class I SAM-dependent methyltransferase [Bacteroidota bacterium]
MQNSKFYDNVSVFYDEMISFDKALERRISALKNFITDEKDAADLGCGTGIDSIALSKLGLKVTAIDNSSSMIEKARSNAISEKLEINFIKASLTSLPENLHSQFDMAVSLGNTLANISKDLLEQSINNIALILKSGGKAVVQILNYNLFLKEENMQINKFEDDKNIIERYYERDNDKLIFCINKTDKSNKTRSTIRTDIYPHLPEEIVFHFNKYNFSAKIFGGLDKSEFVEAKSKDLILLAKKR